MIARFTLLGTLVAFVALPAFGTADHGDADPDAIVLMREFEYDPGTGLPVLEVAPGALLMFLNFGDLDHTVDSRGVFELHSGAIAPGDHFTFVAPDTGVYELHCETNEVHTVQMHMLLVVR